MITSQPCLSKIINQSFIDIWRLSVIFCPRHRLPAMARDSSVVWATGSLSLSPPHIPTAWQVDNLYYSNCISLPTYHFSTIGLVSLLNKSTHSTTRRGQTRNKSNGTIGDKKSQEEQEGRKRGMCNTWGKGCSDLTYSKSCLQTGRFNFVRRRSIYDCKATFGYQQSTKKK